MKAKKSRINRRTFFTTSTKASAAIAAGSILTNADVESWAQNVNRNSSPSDLKITDLRVVPIHGRWICRVYTNQGVTGLGELRDGSSPTYVLMLKSRILGENPLNVDFIFRKLKQFGHHARQAAGPVAIEEACWDIAGKVWGVPCWQMLGGKMRTKIRMYADTPYRNDPRETGRQLQARMDHGFTFLKVDFGIRSLPRDGEGLLTWPKGGGEDGIDPWDQWNNDRRSGYTEHPFTGIRITEKGFDVMAEWLAGVRETVGWEIPIASDHYGHAILNDQIQMVQRLEEFNLAWIEDAVPWFYHDMLRELKHATNTPILTGEDIYLKEDFEALCAGDCVDMIHPDLATSGGMLETKKIGDMAEEYGVSMPMHMAGNFVTWFSSVHCAAATYNFLVMEHHNPDDQWYEDVFTSAVGKPTMKEDGFVPVPDAPGLGVEMNEDVVKDMLEDDSQFFPPTDEWNDESAHDRLWSMFRQEQRGIRHIRQA